MSDGARSPIARNRRWRVEIALDDAAAIAMLEKSLPAAVERRVVRPGDPPHPASAEAPTIVFEEIPVTTADRGGVSRDTRCRSIIHVCRDEPLARRWADIADFGIPRAMDSRLLSEPGCVAAAVGCALGDPWRFDPEASIGGASPQSMSITSAAARDRLVETVVGELRRTRWTNSIDQLRLATEELVNNALLHAFEVDRGRRYVPGAFERLHDDDTVSARFAIDAGHFWLSVADNAGVLDPQHVRELILRHLEEEGLLDGGGRGLFICFSVANILAIAIDRGRLTEVTVAAFRDRDCDQKMVLFSTPPSS